VQQKKQGGRYIVKSSLTNNKLKKKGGTMKTKKGIKLRRPVEKEL
jgi:hypothetical protein